MIIEFTKAKNNKLNILRITRSDGSSTWSKLHPGLDIHDLVHYVVETTLGAKEGFYGLIDNGIEIEDFNLPKEKRPQQIATQSLPLEAIQIEYIVNRLEVLFVNSGNDPDFMEGLKETLDLRNIPLPSSLNIQKVETMQQKLEELIFQWRALQPGASLKLTFPSR